MTELPDHAIPVAYLRDIVELAGRWNVAPAKLLAGLPLGAEALADPSTRVPAAVGAELVARAERLTGEPALAIHFGIQMRLSSHGFLGFAAMTAGTLREAIELAVRYARIRSSAISLSLQVEEGTASLVIEERAPLGPLREFAVLSLVVGLWRMGEAQTGRRLEGHAECAFPRPAYLDRLPPVNQRLRFDRPSNRLIFAAGLLDLPLLAADPLATQLARAACERELGAVVDAGLPGRVRAAIAERGDRAPSVVEVARALHLSPRTLKRKLAARGTSYSAILAEVRRERALLLLGNPALSIGEIAGRLGYTEPPNFIRAFRKWTGMTPAAFRAK